MSIVFTLQETVEKKMEMIYFVDSVGKDRDKKDGDDLR